MLATDELVVPADLAALFRRTLLSFLVPPNLKRAVRSALAAGSQPHEVLVYLSRQGAPGGLVEAVSAFLETLKS
jgi:hypothetical protein